MKWSGCYVHSRVDLDEVVAVLLIDQKLGCSSIAVVDRLGQLDCISENGIASLDWQILCWCKFNNLLMTSLDGAITLVQMHDVAVVVSKKLDLDVLGFV